MEEVIFDLAKRSEEVGSGHVRLHFRSGPLDSWNVGNGYEWHGRKKLVDWRSGFEAFPLKQKETRFLGRKNRSRAFVSPQMEERKMA